MDEIRDAAVDRRAMTILLAHFPQTRGIDPARASVGLMNETWARMASVLAAMDDARFNAIAGKAAADRTDLSARRARSAAAYPNAAFESEDEAIAALARVEELLDLIVDWRHGTWEAAEIEAGRDPHQVDVP